MRRVSSNTRCPECDLVTRYTKKFEYEAKNLYCKYSRNKTITEWEK